MPAIEEAEKVVHAGPESPDRRIRQRRGDDKDPKRSRQRTRLYGIVLPVLTCGAAHPS
jgi:hypothetical protein